VSFQPIAACTRLVHDRALAHDAGRTQGAGLLSRKLLLTRGTDVSEAPQTRTLVGAVVDGRPFGALAGGLAVPESVRAAVGQVVYIGWVVIIVCERLCLRSTNVIIIMTLIIIIIAISISSNCSSSSTLIIILIIIVIVIILIGCIAVVTKLVLRRA
jgi:hypothetical protein